MPTWNTGSTTVRSPISGDPRIAALQDGLRSSEHWNPAQPITFSFPTTGALFSGGQNYGNDEIREGWLPLGAAQQQAVRWALNAWASVANIQFVEVAEASTQVGELRFAFSFGVDADAVAHAYLPTSRSAEAGDVWLTPDWQDQSFAPTTLAASAYDIEQRFAYATLLHEIGHALGLGHPFEGSDPLPAAEDHIRNTLMSYEWNDPEVGFAPASTPMPYDILAIQYLYGANMRFEAGDTVWTFDMADANLSTVWDAGGTDTLRLTNTQGLPTFDLASAPWSVIDLADGAGSHIGFVNKAAYDATDLLFGPARYPDYGVSPTVFIAYGAVIENAVGAASPDVIYGNAHDNRLDGGGDQWQDHIDGREGLDTAVYTGRLSDYGVARGGPSTGSVGGARSDIEARKEYAVTRAGTDAGQSQDWLVNVERLAFSDVNVALDLDAGEAGANAVGLVTALLGPQALSNAALMGELIHYADRLPLQSMAQILVSGGITAALAGGSSDGALLQLLFRNVVGQNASADDLQSLLSITRDQHYSQTDMLTVIAGLPETQARADLVSFQQHGLSYLEFG
ncbi:MAG: matrixin family metalloprotease [Comamonadaceae bacterium]|nr:MAG: matrixin family metalloprotease [Comamonadaceae bacterium]